jgi:Leucine-rich repeat (LRR) protein
MILLDNCIESLPESIGELKMLRFLALPNNKKLTKLPESLTKLPMLFFLNVKGCPNVRVPQAILDNSEDMCGGCGMYDINASNLS